METEQAYFKYEVNEITNTWLLDIFGVKNNGGRCRPRTFQFGLGLR